MNKVSWAIPVMICGLIFVFAFALSMFLGITELSIVGLALDFLLGSFIGYIVWLLL